MCLLCPIQDMSGTRTAAERRSTFSVKSERFRSNFSTVACDAGLAWPKSFRACGAEGQHSAEARW